MLLHDLQRSEQSSLAVQDLSSNGTFLNGRKLKSASDGAARQWLSSGDRISLVMSVKPLAEQYYTYHTGEHHGCADRRLWHTLVQAHVCILYGLFMLPRACQRSRVCWQHHPYWAGLRHLFGGIHVSQRCRNVDRGPAKKH